MPAKSRAQFRLMEAVAHGWKKPGGGGPSAAVGKEFVAATKSPKSLPERKAKKKFQHE